VLSGLSRVTSHRPVSLVKPQQLTSPPFEPRHPLPTLIKAGQTVRDVSSPPGIPAFRGELEISVFILCREGIFEVFEVCVGAEDDSVAFAGDQGADPLG
jgi:hypothetical protein